MMDDYFFLIIVKYAFIILKNYNIYYKKLYQNQYTNKTQFKIFFFSTKGKWNQQHASATPTPTAS